jgi:CRP/FNR family transcriptional regulator, anaerobic regulatory protein
MESLLNFLGAFHPLSSKLREFLMKVIKERKLKKGEIILKPGQINRQICFIRNGLLRAFYIRNETEVSAWFMKEGDLIVSILSFYDQVPTFESIQAIEETEIYYIDYSELMYCYKTFSEFNFIGRELTTKYLKLWAWQLFSIRMQSAKNRYDWLLANHSELVQRVPAKYLASYLGITEVRLSQIKNYFSKNEEQK